ncbi:hypothetical protein FOQG_11960 [Fusarium oxysporum f. sp. raphani 54005]|uniref:Uncharacterized protein n=2 Tax=Fusarium oxysporum TaxID=5507 RepID=X0BNP8_FUSOX|nr:hypothetical protein FOVG_02088 [Fusarium oxysporum f. sp. pisi HDV247]EXK83800.1 hypothetical protein FOQG_11960 [Fusarium oxysporum f. sp. raphani 54005]
MASSATNPKSPLSQSGAIKEYNDRIQDWLLDPGLDIQGRLLADGHLTVQPQPPKGKDAPTKPSPKAHI